MRNGIEGMLPTSRLRLRMRVNRTKSAVAHVSERKFLGHRLLAVPADSYPVNDGSGSTVGAGFHFWEQSIDAETIAHEAMHGMWTAENNYLGWQHDVLYEGRPMNGDTGWETYCTT